MNYTLFYLVFLFICLNSSRASFPRNYLTVGSSASVEDELEILVSPGKTFTCGFQGTRGNAYYFAIWFTGSRDRTMVWMANRDKPVNGKGSRLTFRGDGVLILTDVDGTIAWETNTTSTDAHKAELLESGNLVMKDQSGRVLWESFEHPTDTLLPNQPFFKNTKLTSSIGRGSYYSGYFNFYFDNDNVLRLMYDGPDISSIYWPNPDNIPFGNGRTTYNSTRLAVLDDTGSFLSSDRFQFNATNRGKGIKRRLTIDHDGNLRLFSLNNSDGSWEVSWQAMNVMCRVHGVCGRNGICVYTPAPKCSCPPGYETRNPKNWNSGCKPKFVIKCSNYSSDKVRFVELPYTDFYGFDLYYNYTASFEWCRDKCLADCNCLGFAYRTNGERLCFGKSALFNGVNTPAFPANIYLKLPVSYRVSSAVSKLNGSDPICPSSGESTLLAGSSTMYNGIGRKIKWEYFYWFASIIGGLEILMLLCGWFILFRKSDGPGPLEDGYRVLSSQFKKFSYAELKTATRNFREEIGRGGSGIVYKGNLGDGREVAVKRLGDIHHGEEFFWAEVSTIGKINHMNLARMWGFCAEGKNRLLVYEFITNQSLDKHLFVKGSNLRWKERFRIAVGTAKGLAYLHHECLEWVIHCDVKPENILLDSDFEPKIADFGLAKLLQRGNASSEFSRIRGTKGYMAPEWALNLPITAKVDVFSYGVMVLEMVRGVRVSNWAITKGVEEEETEEEAELTKLVRIVRRKIHSDCGDDSWLEDVVDWSLMGHYSKRQARALVEVGIACAEEDRNKRPTMDAVVHILLDCDDEPKEVTNSPGRLTGSPSTV